MPLKHSCTCLLLHLHINLHVHIGMELPGERIALYSHTKQYSKIVGFGKTVWQLFENCTKFHSVIFIIDMLYNWNSKQWLITYCMLNVAITELNKIWCLQGGHRFVAINGITVMYSGRMCH